MTNDPRATRRPRGTTNNNLGGARNAVQASQLIGNIYFGDSTKESPEEHRAPTFTMPSPLAMLIGILIVLFIIIASCVANLVNDAKTAFPEENGTRPAGSNERAVNAAVVDKLRSCAKAVVLKPQNCPQGTDGYQPQNVQWAIHGDPTDGAHLAWHDDRFYVRGNTVMTVSFMDNTQAWQFKTQVVTFQAEVAWKDGKAVVDSIKEVGTTPDNTVKKRDPSISEEQVSTTLRGAFAQCAASKSAPMPPNCPNNYTTPRINEAAWKFAGDPVLNSSQNFDETSGIIHVIGSFAATVRDTGQSFFSGGTWVQDGNYEALLIKDQGMLLVLQIQATP